MNGLTDPNYRKASLLKLLTVPIDVCSVLLIIEPEIHPDKNIKTKI